MKTQQRFKQMASLALLSGVGAAAALGLSAGTAQATYGAGEGSIDA